MTPRRLFRRLGDPSMMALAAVLVLSLYGVTRSIGDPDFWWHLKTGQILIATHHLIPTDPFTYTAASHAWTMHEWLTEVLEAALFGAGGVGLVVLFFSLVTWSGMLAMAARAALDRPHRLVLAAGVVLALITGNPVWGPRPQMYDFAGVCLTLLLAEYHLHRGGRQIWWLVPAFLLWSNLHSGFVIGIALLLLICVAETAGLALGWTSEATWKRLRTLALVALAGVVASMINPNGPGIVLYPFGTVGSVEQQQLIQEWHSPSFHDFIIRVGFAPMVASLAVFVVVNRRIRPRDAGIAIATVALSLQSERNIGLFVAAATPIWIMQCDTFLKRLLPRMFSAATRFPATAFMSICSALVLLVMAGVDGVGIARDMRIGPNDISIARDQPVCAARWLSAAPIPLRIFNQYGEGGYLAYTLSANGDRVYIFGDAALMGDQLLRNYGNIDNLNPAWDNLIENSGTQVILFDAGTSLANVLDVSPRWQRVYSDPKSEIWIKTGSPLLSRLSMPAESNGARSGVCAQLMSRGLGS